MTNEEKLLWMTTVAESSPEEICNLLDQMEGTNCSDFSVKQGWEDLQKAHPQRFPSRLHRPREFRRFCSAAALFAVTVALSAVTLLPPGKPASSNTNQVLTGYFSLYSMVSLDSSPAVTPIRAELPMEVFLSEGPAQLPTDAELYCISKSPYFPVSEDIDTSNVDESPFLLLPEK